MSSLISQIRVSFIILSYLVLVCLSSAAEEVQGIEGIFQYAETLFKNQQYTAAQTEYLQLLSLDSQYISADSARYRLGWCAYNLHEYELAIAQLTYLINFYPKSTLIHQAQQTRQFIYESTDFIPTIDSDPAIIPFSLARKYQAEKNDLDAIGFYERVVQYSPGSVYAPYAAYNIAQIHESNYWKLYSSFTEKKAEYQRVYCEKTSPNIIVQSFAETALQEELMDQQFQQTVLAYSRVTEHYPDSFQCQLSHRELGNLYLQTSKSEEAKKEYTVLLELTREFPNSSLAYQAQEQLKLIK